MSRKIPKQSLPHYGVKNGLTREGKTILTPIYYQEKVGETPALEADGQPKLNEDGTPLMEPIMEKRLRIDRKTLHSISQAKRFMRTGQALRG